MTGTDMDRDDERLDALFAAARAAPQVPSEALLARVLADAEAELPRSADLPAEPPGRADPVAGGWLAALGGWRGFGGLATATVAGLWIGYAGLSDPTAFGGGLVGGLIGADADVTQVELLPGTEVLVLADGWEG